ncbi:MAG: hypothetical protein CBC95_000765 [Crocinitomicaceae bacterium TMED135]|nr:MAG: hypothetical protein CBC95_000765 [Crocinitomicaceae bacterium TMED135]|tara:strand:+ start:631 stop:1839 length:1209 start_codon:yes stop_codon:yes gene_type:complete
MKSITLLLFTMTFTLCSQINAQFAEGDSLSSKNLFLIIKNDGGEYIGEIISDDGREILVITKQVGKLYLNKSEISSISKVEEKISSIKNGEFRASGPFTTRYYFTNNALPIKRNENYGLIHVYGPEVHLSVANKTSVGVMASWIASPIALALKQQILSYKKFHFSIGSIIGSSGYINQGQTYGGLHWGTITLGDRSSNISFSAGVAHINWPSNDDNFMSGIREIGERFSYSFYDETHPYFIAEEDYNAQYAFEDSLNISSNWGWNGNGDNSRYFYKNKQLATVIGISGIAPIGKKASFIFDSMVFITENQDVNYKTKEKDIIYERFDSQGNSMLTPFTAKYGVGSIANTTTRNITFILMPAMRFNKSYEKAFQVALAGFINYDELDGLQSAPIPMISWLRKF